MAEGFQPTGFQSDGFQGTAGVVVIQELAGSITCVSTTVGNIFLLHVLLLEAVAVTSGVTGMAFLIHFLTSTISGAATTVGSIFSLMAFAGMTVGTAVLGGTMFLLHYIQQITEAISALVGNLDTSGGTTTTTAAAKKPKYMGGVIHSRNRRRR